MHRRRLQALAVAAIIALAIGTTAMLDRDTDALVSVVKLALENVRSDALSVSSSPGVDIPGEIGAPYVDANHSLLPGWSRALRATDFVVAPFFLLLVLGGLPISLFAAVADRQRRTHVERATPLPLALSYAGLAWQVVSVLLSVLLVFLFASAGPSRPESPLLFYFVMQLGFGIYAVPCWRRLFDDASQARSRARFFLNAA